ncbi:MAG: hypothetical protein AB9873_05590 [Syntrophobacteraceae bacterium]
MKHPVRTRLIHALGGLALLGLLSTVSPCHAEPWHEVGRGMQHSISGLALLSDREGQTTLVVVHDNKAAGEPRLGLVDLSSEGIRYRPLAWPAGKDAPVDLESIASIPGQPGLFLTATSSGMVFPVTVSEKEVTVEPEFSLPNLSARANIEGLSVQRLQGRMVVIWGDRGEGAHPGTLYWGDLDLPNRRIINASEATVRAPFPSPLDSDIRHIADLKLDAGGVIWGAATKDPGDSGPFASVVYSLGTLSVSESQGAFFQANSEPSRLWVFPKKVEAIELVPGPTGTIVFGTDDENDGGWISYFR